MLCHPCIFGDPQTTGDKIRIGCLTPAFSRAQKRAEMLRHPYILMDPQTKGDKIRIGCLTPAFAGARKRAEMLCHPCILGDPQTKGDKIRIGCLTPAFAGAQKRAEMLCHPCILGGPQTKGDKIRIGCIGDKDKTMGMQPKRISPKFFSHKWCACIEKHPQNPPTDHFLTKGGFSETPHGIGFLRTPPPLVFPLPQVACTLEAHKTVSVPPPPQLGEKWTNKQFPSCPYPPFLTNCLPPSLCR